MYKGQESQARNAASGCVSHQRVESSSRTGYNESSTTGGCNWVLIRWLECWRVEEMVGDYARASRNNWWLAGVAELQLVEPLGILSCWLGSWPPTKECPNGDTWDKKNLNCHVFQGRHPDIMEETTGAREKQFRIGKVPNHGLCSKELEWNAKKQAFHMIG